MSTIASPRDSSSVRSPSSSRTSLDFSLTNAATPTITTTSARPSPNLRRNRTALRDYYNLKTNNSPHLPTQSPSTTLGPVSPSSELDAPSFSPQAHVTSLLATHPLSDVLRAESALVAEIKSLDGERKALVYDNYSKLIAATETIARMRTNMDPLTPATRTLAPAVAHIAETARGLSEGLARRTGMQAGRGDDGGGGAGQGEEGAGPREEEDDERRKRELATVRWVLAAPARLERLIADGRMAEAQEDWTEVRGLLDKWDDVAGSRQVKSRCEAIMNRI